VYKDLFSLSGKIALVVGAAGGLAKDSCIALANFGAKLLLADINENELQALGNELDRINVSNSRYAVDIVDTESIKLLIEEIQTEYGRLDVMINFAGLGWRTPVEKIQLDEFEKIVRTNLTGSFLLTQQALKLMLPQNSGKIILIGSVSGQIGRPYVAHYAASKGGIHSLVRTLAVELAKNNIQINSVAPAFTLTKMTFEILSDPAVKESIISTIPIGRLGSPSDLVGTILLLSTHASDFITGQTIFVDGGCTIS